MNQSLRKAHHGVTLLVLALIMAFSFNVAFAKNMVKQNLLDLMSHSDSILIGTVSEKTDGMQQGLPYTEITLDVGQSLKGNHGSTYTFRQFGLIAPKSTGDGRVNLMVTPAGWPVYIKGEQVMLFLHEPASVTGFQTTAGLTQGKFTIKNNRIANDINNESLFAGVKINGKLSSTQQALVKQAGGSYKTEDFLTLVKTAVEESWIENGVMTHED